MEHNVNIICYNLYKIQHHNFKTNYIGYMNFLLTLFSMQILCNTFNPLSNISSTQFFDNNVNYVIFNYVIQDQNSIHKITAVHFRTYLPAIICVSLKRLHAKASNYPLG